MIYVKKLVTLLWASFILMGSLTPKVPEIDLPFWIRTLQPDKWFHVLAYLILTVLFMVSFLNKNSNRYIAWIILIGIVMYGLLIEILQGNLVENRHFEVLDIIANIMGTLVGTYLFQQYLKNF